MKKVLFLDVDGVLNSYTWWEKNKGSTYLVDVDPDAVARLLRVLHATSAEVVLSSTWRLVPDYVTQLKNIGIPIASATPRLDGEPRWKEIIAWLAYNLGTEIIAILDDDSDAWNVAAFSPTVFIQTDARYGLIEAQVEPLIRILGRK